MVIYFRTKRIQKICSKQNIAQMKLNVNMARKLQQRMMELQAAETLTDMAMLPSARCHELTGDRKGQLSVDLVHPYRLLFVPSNNPVPRKNDGGLDWSRVTEIMIIDIDDTH